MANELPVLTILGGIPGPAGTGFTTGQANAVRLVTDHILTGTGSPEGVVTGAVGDEYVQTDAGALTAVRWLKMVGTDQWGWLRIAGFESDRIHRSAAADQNAATISTARMAAWTLGTGATSGDNAALALVNFATSGTLNDAKGPNGPEVARFDHGFDVSFSIVVIDTTNVRDWVGLFASDPSGADATLADGCGFRFSTSASDTVWQAHSADGAAGARTATGVAVAATSYRLRMAGGSALGAIDYYVNGTHVARRTTNLPTATANLKPYCRVTNVSVAGVKNLKFGAFDWMRYS